MRRREFITLLGNAAAAWPIATRAEQPAKLPTIGFLGLFTPVNEWIAAFEQRLSELRWAVGNTVMIEYRSAEGRNDRLAGFAAEFVRLKVDAIVTLGTPPALAMMQATSVIPIVFVAVGDPVANGLRGAKPADILADDERRTLLVLVDIAIALLSAGLIVDIMRSSWP
jgi:putative ABC transport system substrate-binding protein